MGPTVILGLNSQQSLLFSDPETPLLQLRIIVTSLLALLGLWKLGHPGLLWCSLRHLA